ncbi:Fanconi anemia-associated protein of 100 kDa [Notothenia coriiceps]|uniref:Fanconi anemia-associated protein of 100 kDa n=1 Tax=Notothenia coriiceps TaxID=8208 RepID=A0A6I9NRE2_9TELE|nr:PREDICTED: Fanconi anemia-associated protein of 100 kDa [Notothenia coriiceps]
MDGRCAVETCAEFGFAGTSCTPRIRCGFGTDVLLCTGSDEAYVFSTQEGKLKAVLQCPGPVSDLVVSHDKQRLYVACRSGVYCVSSELLLSRVKGSPADASSGPSELKISSESLVVAEEGVLSLLPVGSVLVTLSQRDASWMLALYKSSNYEKLSSFSQFSGDVNTEEKTEIRRSPVLICVHSRDATPSSSSSNSSSDEAPSQGHFHLDPVLFKLLFGVDIALAKSPVILCGLPDGCVCFVPLCLPGSRLRVLHSLEQPVVFVGSSGPGRCLVAVGALGRVVLMKADKGGSTEGRRNVLTEGCVPGPVVCGCVDKNTVYYSTGSDLLLLDLSEGKSGEEGQGKDEETRRKMDAALQSPTSLNVCRVVALAPPTCNTAAPGVVELLGLSVRGQLQRMRLPVRTEDSRLSSGSDSQVGRSVRDLLSSIGDVCERASVLKTSIKSKNQILQRLNQVLNISFLLMAGANGAEHPPLQENPIRCRASTSWSRLLQEDSLTLTCVLDNSSAYVLERGWTLSITVFPLCPPPSAGGENLSTNFSFPFQSLHPGETLDVSLPLAAAGESSFPVTVSCSLLFSLASLLGEEAANLPALQSSCISLPLNTLTVDWLHALQVSSPKAAREKITPHATDAIEAFLRSHRIRCGGNAEGGREGGLKYSASVRVSAELLRDTLMVVKSSHLDPAGTKTAPENVCLSLLEWLLSEGPGGVTTGQKGDQMAMRGSVVHAQSLNRHAVKLTAKEVNVGVEESLNTVEVQVHSSSIAAVCGLHHALLRRVQTLLQRAPERAASTKRVQSLGLREALRRAEHLLQQIQQSRVSGVFSGGASTEQMSRTLLDVYRELRENPLVII